ncbi:proline-rich protein 4 isoform X2 [Lycium ferocissimum]|uniref:proline-rich protein 4 isoform X2 n=1 Tax=Lycium ferocissimum TaxID=112874 RepID=UPI002815E331|nr:proline-rich protein 4 isoform X2 [Lycium ferocissimum]
MGLQSLCGRVLIGFYVSLILLFAVSFCYADDKTIQVVGIGECADCKESNIKTIHAFSGLRVTIDCKAGNGKFKTRGEGQLDKDGKFVVSLPKEMVKDGKLKEDCYAQLHSASAAPCPAHNGIEASKIVFTKSENNDEKHTLKPAGNLKFSTALCTSKFFFFFHHFKHPLFPPIDKKPLPPIPIYKPKPPVFKIPPIPIYKPIPKPPLPPIPIYKPIPPFLKKPWPPLFPKVPIMHPKLPPFDFHHPLFPPSIAHP